tara:strand:- start:5 stop:862 length:858 start_codon:yes stop_codon:yes gene_type:complete
MNGLKRFKRFYLENKDFLPLVVLLPTILGGMLQTIQLIIIGPEYIRFFSITQLVSDGILILSILSIIYISYLFLRRYYNFKKITAHNISLKFAVRRLVLIIFIFSLIFLLYYVNKEFEYISAEYSIGSFLVYGFLAFFILPLVIQFIILFFFILIRFITYLLIKWKGIDKLEVYISNKERLRASLEPIVNILIMIFIVPIAFLLIGGFMLIIQFGVSTNNPHKLANLECVSTLVNEKYGDNQDSHILYFNDKYFFIKITDTLSDKDDVQVILFKTENVLFKDNCR